MLESGSITAVMSKDLNVLANSDDVIEWKPAERSRWSKTVHAVSYGVECSRCKSFQDYETRYCKDCGGIYIGVLPNFNKKSERKLRHHNG